MREEIILSSGKAMRALQGVGKRTRSQQIVLSRNIRVLGWNGGARSKGSTEP